jgi:DNA-directed RNA polymerase subunit RPC12/RpoP
MGPKEARSVAGGTDMSNVTYFVQECPTCGRRLQIRVEYLGKAVVCEHCRGRLIARDPASNRYGSYNSVLMDRADELLKHSAPSAVQSRLPHPR